MGAVMDDYNELNLYLEQDQTVDLWVYTEVNKCFVVKDVNNNPVRYQGWWYGFSGPCRGRKQALWKHRLAS